jgi:hypothetical protein
VNKQTETAAEAAEPRGCPTPGACSALSEIERLRAGLNDVRKFLSNPEWGTVRYMEGSGVYEDKDQALFDIAYALGEIR